MKQSIPFFIAAVFVAIGVACFGDSGEQDAPAETATPPAAIPTATQVPEAPTPTATIAPTAPAGGSMETGIEVVDEVIEAVLVGDATVLQTLLRFTEAPCTHAFGSGGPPKCFNSPGEPPDGTVVQAFPILSCELEWHADPLPSLTGLLDQQPALYAVIDLEIEGPLFNEPYLPSPDYAVVIQTDVAGDVRGHLLMIEDGAVVGIDHACGGSPALLLDSKLYINRFEVILEGPEYVAMRPGAALAPYGIVSGIPELDVVIATLLGRDVDKTTSLFELSDVPRTTATGLGGPPKCEYAPGQPPEGTLVSALPAGGCEGHWRYDSGQTAESVLKQDLTLFAVLKVDLAGPMWGESYMPSPDHEILFQWSPTDGRRFALSLLTEDGAIVFLDGGCGTPPEQRLDLDHSRPWPYEVILRGPAYR